MQGAVGRRVAPLLPAGLDAQTAHGKRQGTTRLGHASAAAGYEATALDEIAKGSDSLPASGSFDSEKKPQIYPKGLLLDGLLCVRRSRAGGPGPSLLPHDTLCPEKFHPEKSKAKGSFDVKARLAIATQDEFQALEKSPAPSQS